MEFVDRPIIEFYRDSLSAASKRGFLWVVTLLAREADVDGLYLNLRRSWTSLDSITGKYFLFVFAGKENVTDDDRWNSRVVDSDVGFFSEYNNYVKIINQNIELSDSYIHDNYHKRKCADMDRLEDSQTSAINSLRDYFSISENEIPCLVFTRLEPLCSSYSRVIQVVPISGNNVYGYFKRLFNVIDPLLKQHKAMVIRLKELTECKKEKEIIISQENFRCATEIAQAKIELSIIEHQRNELGEQCGSILSEIEKIIGDSKMNENTAKYDRLSISVMGGTAQINAAFDNANVEAVQYAGFDEKKLAELVRNVRNTLSSDMPADDIEMVNNDLNVIEDELRSEKPRKGFLKVALKGLKAITGTVEFSAAVASLAQFIQPMLL